MLVFSKDVDILKYEAVLFSDLYFPWQVLCAGSNGQISGTSFTASSEDFVSAGIASEGVIYLRSSDGSLDGAYEIVSVDSATELTVSVVRPELSDSPVSPLQGSAISYRVSTFAPQSHEVGVELTRYFGIKPGAADSEYGVEEVLDVSVLKQPSVYAVMSTIYAILGSGTEERGNFWDRSFHYQKLFERSRQRCRLSIDIDGDGLAEKTTRGGITKLMRE